MAGEKYNIQLEAIEIFNRLQQVPQLAEGLSNLLQNFNSHNHDLRNDTRYQPLGDYAADVHTHPATDITEDSTHKFMTQTEKNTLSSLGTTYAKADMSNIATYRFSTGATSSYIKFSNGLLICWGWINSTGLTRMVYLPISFANDSYRVSLTSETPVATVVVSSITVNNKSVSAFKVRGDFHNATTGASGYPSEAFDWIAIGKWK